LFKYFHYEKTKRPAGLKDLKIGLIQPAGRSSA